MSGPGSGRMAERHGALAVSEPPVAEPVPSGAAPSEPAVARRSAWWSVTLVGAAIVAVDAAWFVALAAMIEWFYTVQLPHYDSVGSFIGMFPVMHETARHGLAAGLAAAVLNPLSWFQSMYAALMGAILPVTPVAVVGVNLVALLIAQAAIVVVIYSETRSCWVAFLASLLPFVPATMAAWDGGYPDPRRDPSLFLMLLATFFTGLLYANRPSSWRSGLAFGVCAGLSIWARGNSLPYVGLVMLPFGVAALVRWARSGERRGGLLGLVRLAFWPLFPFFVLTGVFFAATLAMIIEKYAFGSYGIGYDRLESLVLYGLTPVALIFDQNSTPVAGVLALAVIVGAAVGGYRARPGRLLTFVPLMMIGAGLFVALSVLLFNTAAIGVSPLAGRWPFFPALVGSLGILAAPFCLFGPLARPRGVARTMLLSVVCLVASVVVIGGFLDRAWKGATVEHLPYAAGDGIVSAERVATVRAVTLRLSCVAGGRPTAFFWIGDVDRGLGSYYLAQEGRPFLQNFESAAMARMGVRVDLEMPYIPGTDPVARQQEILRALEAADVIVVNENPAAYEGGKVSPHFPYTHGRPIVEQILADQSLVRSFRYTIGDQHFVVLRRPEVLPRTDDPFCADVR